MKLAEYLIQKKLSQAAFAASLNVSPGLLHQWISGKRPFAPHQCVAIERVTGKEVTRPELRPDDWRDIWPELVVAESAPALQAEGN